MKPFRLLFQLSIILQKAQCISQFQLRPAPLPGNCGAFVRLVSPGGGALANLARPGGRAFAYPGAAPELLIRTWFPTRNAKMEDFIGKDQQFVAYWLVRLVEVFSILGISSLLIKAQLVSYHYIYRDQERST